MKKYLNFEELQTLAQKEDFKFSEQIFVQVDADFEIDEQQDKYKEELIPFRCKAYHDSVNANGSKIDPEVFIDNTKSVLGRPVLANIVVGEDGQSDFGAHDFHLEEDENGNVKRIFDEKPIGVVTNYGFAQDEEAGVNRAVVSGYLFERYAQDAVDIMKRRKRCDCSVELVIQAMHWEAESKTLVLDDYFVSGVTILGAEHQPGMTGSEITLEDFSKENNSMVFQAFKHLTQEELSRVQGDWVRDFLVSDDSKEKGGVKMDETVNNEEVKSEEVKPEGLSFVVSVSSKDEKVCEYSMTIDDQFWKVRREFERQVTYDYSWDSLMIYDNFVAYKDAKSLSWYTVDYMLDDKACTFADTPKKTNLIFKTDDELQAEADGLAELQNSLTQAQGRITELESLLSQYDKEKADHQKDEILNDAAYASCTDSEEFAAVVSKKSELSVEDFQMQLDLAFAAVQKKRLTGQTNAESKADSESVLSFSKPKDKNPKTVDSKYGSIFTSKK